MNNFAFVFPGQGSQSVGMLDGWGDHPEVRATLDEASQSLSQDLTQLIARGSKEELSLTTNTQPVMLVAGVAAWRAWRAADGPLPSALAGHSLGEYSALVASGSLSLSQAVPLVRLRAEAMQQAVPVGQGAMAAILGLDAALVEQGCAQALDELGADSHEVVAAANFNDPGQTVIAGSKVGVERACQVLKAMGAKRTLALPVSAPFHCSLMRPAAERLRQHLMQIEFRPPAIPVINNIDVLSPDQPEHIRDALYRQAFGPVRWVESIHSLRTRGMTHIIECGPGNVLGGLVKRIAPDVKIGAIFDPASLAATLSEFQR